MTNERAIERLKERITDNQEKTLQIFLEQDIEAIETVLNLLEKKDKEIQFQKEINKTEQDRHKKTEKNLKGQLKKKNKQIEQYQNMLVTNDMLHVLECEKKDEIIDLMAYDIATNDSDFCQYIDETRRCKEYAGENKLTCDECIKQYYERKVENGN